jgi:hypothetical protein
MYFTPKLAVIFGILQIITYLLTLFQQYSWLFCLKALKFIGISTLRAITFQNSECLDAKASICKN